MKYLVIGAGGVGGVLAGLLAKNGYDVSLVARGSHLDKIKSEGLNIISNAFGNFRVKINAFNQNEYNQKPDVVFICTKYYSIIEILPLIKKVSNKNTIIIPLVNGFQTGKKIQEKLDGLTVLEGCIYIASCINKDGEILHTSNHVRIFFGKRENQLVPDEKLKQIETELNLSSIDAKYSSDIKNDTFTKFSLISPFAACGVYLDVNIGEMQKENTRARKVFLNLLYELKNIAKALNLEVSSTLVDKNLEALKEYAPSTISSCYRDYKNNHQTEVENLIYDVVSLAKELNVKALQYEEIAQNLKSRGL